MNRFLTGCFVGTACAAAVTGSLAALAQGTNGAPRAPFEILGSNDNVIMRVSEGPNGGRLELFGSSGQSIVLDHANAGASVTLQGSGSRKAVIGLTNSGAAVQVVDAGKSALIEVSQSGSRLVLVNEDQNAMLDVGAGAQSLNFAQGDVSRANIGIRDNNTSSVRLLNASGSAVANLSAATTGAGALLIGDSSGNLVAQAAVTDIGPIMGISPNGGDGGIYLMPSIDGAGGKIEISDSNATVVFAAGVSSNGGGLACAYAANGRQRCLP